MERQPQLAYLRAQDAIIALVAGPDYPSGAKIPSERSLAEQLGISRMTVRQAVENLVRLGTLERDSTSGTRVSAPGVVRNLAARSASSMTKLVERAGAQPGTRLLQFERRRAEAPLARSLMLARGDQVLTVRRLRLADGVPFCIETSSLPASRVPGLRAADLMGDASLYGVLEARYSLVPARRQGRIRVASVAAEDAALLAIDAGTSVLEYRSTVSDQDGRPIEAVVSLNHPQLVAFTVEDPLAGTTGLQPLTQAWRPGGRAG